jgi:hypothetical protein
MDPPSFNFVNLIEFHPDIVPPSPAESERQPRRGRFDMLTLTNLRESHYPTTSSVYESPAPPITTMNEWGVGWWNRGIVNL